jgi:hypothetical protein
MSIVVANFGGAGGQFCLGRPARRPRAVSSRAHHRSPERSGPGHQASVLSNC